MRRILSALVLSSLIALPATASETVDAAWKAHKVDFGYVSLETAYSCELMKAKITALLRHLGAADGVEVTVTPCTGFDRPQRRHQIIVEFKSLAPAGDATGDVVKAAWSEVELGRWQPSTIDGRDCELLEQFEEHVLPAIEHRVIEGMARCNATRSSIIGTLKLEVLKPVAAEAPPEKEDEQGAGSTTAAAASGAKLAVAR